MPYREIDGNLFSSTAQAYVNTVNCVGVMGKGIALEFRRRYPDMFAKYVADCTAKRLISNPSFCYIIAGKKKNPIPKIK
jgi:O-acetyl-ADP-ribose deacetylase (regulator of RNase III)